MTAHPFKTRSAKQRASSQTLMLWKDRDTLGSRYEPQVLEWDAVLDCYISPLEATALEAVDVLGWSPVCANPYKRQANCTRIVCGAIVTLERESEGDTCALVACFNHMDGIIWRRPDDFWEVVLPLAAPVSVKDFQDRFTTPELPPGWCLATDPLDACTWHPIPYHTHEAVHEAWRLGGERIVLVKPLPPLEPTLPAAPLPPELAPLLVGTRLEHCSGDLRAILRPALRLSETKRRISKTAQPPLGASRFGGEPDLPEDVAWPTYLDVPMSFLCQFDLEALTKEVGDSLLPVSGFLWFFFNRREDTSSAPWVEEAANALGDPEAAARRKYSVASVIYRDTARDTLQRRPEPKHDNATEDDHAPLVYTRWHLLTAARFDTFPSYLSPFVPKAIAEANYVELVEDYNDATEAWGACALLGHIGEPDWVGACKEDTQLLLKLSSHNRTAFTWGDMDNIHFVMPAKDLARRRFDRVAVHCGLG